MRIPKSDRGELLAYFVIAILIFLSMAVKAQAGLVKVVADLQVCSGGLLCQNQTSYGSGVCVGYYKDKSIVITAGHILQGHDKDGVPCPAKLHRLRVQGASARVLGSWVDNKANDFAILLVDYQFKEVVPIGLPPKAGDSITIYGYDYAVSSAPQLSTRSGKILKVQKGEMSAVDFTSAVGVSGGPALDTSGNLAGILVWSSSIMPNFGFRESIKQLLRDANLPPPHAPKTTRQEVPDPPADSLVDKTVYQKIQNEIDRLTKESVDSQKEIAQLKKEKETWIAKTKSTQESGSETTVSDTGKQSPATEDTSLPEDSGDSDGSGSLTPESSADPSTSSRIVTGVGKVIDAAEVGISAADKVLSNPLVMAALAATGVGTGLVGAKAGVSLASGLLAWRRRRKEKQGGTVGSVPPHGLQDRADRQVFQKKDVPTAQTVAPAKDCRIDAVIEYLKDKEKPLDVEAIAKSLSGLLVTQELQSDGKTTEEQLWKDGVRLAKEGALKLNVLGGKQVAKSIEDFVYSEQARLDEKTLRGTN